MEMGTSGVVDLCMQSHVVGWAMQTGQPATVSIHVNDRLVGRAGGNVCRPELAPFHIPVQSGFCFHFAEPLTMDDEVSVTLSNGAHLQWSPTRQHRGHLGQMLHGVTGGAGLEFGAHDRPLLSKARSDVSFVDHADKAGLMSKYAQAGNLALVSPERIAGIDYVWPGGVLDAVVGGRRFDWAVAAGVVEHIGDPIGWLQQIASVISLGGRVNLGIPHQALTFDRMRRLTTPAEMLEDHFRGLLRPSFRQIVDHIAGALPVGSPAPGPADQAERFRQAVAVAKHAEQTAMYVDVHCHVWTPESWIDCWNAVVALKLSPLRVDKVFDPLVETGQFVVSMIKT